MNYRAYLRAVDLAIRARSPVASVAFDAGRGAWRRGDFEVRTRSIDVRTMRFELFVAGTSETYAGGYSGHIGAPIEELVEYLVYFLDVGKPWHQGLPNRGLA